MVILTIEVRADGEAVDGIKEDLAMYLERWGDCRVTKIESKPEYEQTSIFGNER